jgi:hypothetical protein
MSIKKYLSHVKNSISEGIEGNALKSNFVNIMNEQGELDLNQSR